jgi:DNA/RNA endonuclease YhcR with UshA esterase domain
MANNIILQPAAGDALTLTAVATSVTWGGAAGLIQGSAVYTGTITRGASNGLRGKAFTVAGFTNVLNNGTFLCMASTATTLTLNDAYAVAETHAATATYSTQGFPVSYATKIENMWSNNQGDNIQVQANAGDTLVAIAIGLRDYDPFDLLHGASPDFGYLQGLNDFNANPVISDNSSGATPVTITAVNIASNAYSLTSAQGGTAAGGGIGTALGTDASLAILAYGGVTSSIVTNIVGGNVTSGAGSASVSGTINYTPPAAAVAFTSQYQTDLTAAFVFFYGLTATAIGASFASTTFTATATGYNGGPGFVGKASSTLLFSGGTVILDGANLVNPVFVFQVGAALNVTTAATTISLINGATANNVIWVANTAVTFDAHDHVWSGNIIAQQNIILNSATLMTLAGRVLTTTGTVTISGTTTITAPASSVSGPWIVNGTFPAIAGTHSPSGAGNAFVGLYFTVAGFANSVNDGVFLCTASSATQLTLTNTNGIAETHAATATDYVLTITNSGVNTFVPGQVIELSGLNEPFLNGLIITAVAGGLTGTTFSANYPTWSSNYYNAAEPAGALATTGNNVWTLVTNINLVDSDYTVVGTPPVAPNPYPSSKWSIDGYYPSIYVWVADSATGGTYNVNLNSDYQNGIIPPQDLAAGKPIFDGGINFQVFRLSGATAVGSPPVGVDAVAVGVTSANPAFAAPITTTGANGDALISIGLQSSGNAFSAGTVSDVGGSPASGAAMTQISTGRLVGSEAHYIVEFGLTAAGSAGVFNPNFVNPFGYRMVVATIAIKSS